jgi:uncharacterized protein (TIGR02145 family)
MSLIVEGHFYFHIFEAYFNLLLKMKKLLLFTLAAFCMVLICNAAETTDQGVVINGVKWAARNVDRPGTFAKNSRSVGMYYQWGRSVGWSITDPLKAYDADGKKIKAASWNSAFYEGDSWLPENDPCPAGWRVPTREEFEKLCDEGKVTRETIGLTERKKDEYGGAIFAGLKFTDKATGNSIFLPTSGGRGGTDSQLGRQGSTGFYWSSTANFYYRAGYEMCFYGSNKVFASNLADSATGLVVRCVRQE